MALDLAETAPEDAGTPGPHGGKARRPKPGHPPAQPDRGTTGRRLQCLLAQQDGHPPSPAIALDPGIALRSPCSAEARRSSRPPPLARPLSARLEHLPHLAVADALLITASGVRGHDLPPEAHRRGIAQIFRDLPAPREATQNELHGNSANP